MKTFKLLSSPRYIAIAAMVLTSLTTLSSATQAKQTATPSQSQPRKTIKTPALRENIYKVLSQAQAKAEENKPLEAIAILNRLKNKSTLNSYEAAMMWKFYAYIYYSQDKHDQAIHSYEQLLQQEALPLALESEALYSAAQLYFVKEKYQKTIDYLNQWFALVDSPKPQAHIMLGQAYYQQNDINKALTPIKTAISMVEDHSEPAKESWYLLLRAIYFEQNNYQQGVAVLEKLVKHYPKKDYWVQLSSTYGELKQDKKQLSTLEIAYRQGLLDKETEWLTLAQLFIFADIPYKAAKVLEKGMNKGIIAPDEDNLKLLSYAWSTAQEAEKALPALVKAAEKSQSGEIDIQLGSTYYQLDQWDKAVTYLRKGLKKGNTKNASNAQMILGMALFNLNRFDDARHAFTKAAQYEASKASATQWLNYLNNEQERREMIAQTLNSMDNI